MMVMVAASISCPSRLLCSCRSREFEYAPRCESALRRVGVPGAGGCGIAGGELLLLRTASRSIGYIAESPNRWPSAHATRPDTIKPGTRIWTCEPRSGGILHWTIRPVDEIFLTHTTEVEPPARILPEIMTSYRGASCETLLTTSSATAGFGCLRLRSSLDEKARHSVRFVKRRRPSEDWLILAKEGSHRHLGRAASTCHRSSAASALTALTTQSLLRVAASRLSGDRQRTTLPVPSSGPAMFAPPMPQRARAVAFRPGSRAVLQMPPRPPRLKNSCPELHHSRCDGGRQAARVSPLHRQQRAA
jgi:hypothetical protein